MVTRFVSTGYWDELITSPLTLTKTEETSASITIATKEVSPAHQSLGVAVRAAEEDPPEVRPYQSTAGVGRARTASRDRGGVTRGRAQARRGGRHPSLR